MEQSAYQQFLSQLEGLTAAQVEDLAERLAEQAVARTASVPKGSGLARSAGRHGFSVKV